MGAILNFGQKALWDMKFSGTIDFLIPENIPFGPNITLLSQIVLEI